MIYYLSTLFHSQFFTYITVRAGIAFFLSLLLVMVLIPKYIKWAAARKANQPINKYVPAHDAKKHTPTMGGAIFVHDYNNVRFKGVKHAVDEFTKEHNCISIQIPDASGSIVILR
jgi:hypothetical protein